MFGIEAALNILNLRMDEEHWPVIKPILLYLNYIADEQYEEVESDSIVEDFLRKL